MCVSQLAEVGKTSGVCVGDGSFSFAKGNGIWHTLSLPHHTHRADTAVLFFSGPQNGPHYCVCLSQTPTFNPHFVSGSFQPSIYSLLNQFFPPIVKLHLNSALVCYFRECCGNL